MLFLQFVVIITCAQISYENAVSSATQTPDKSPLEMTIKAGLGIAMIEWDDAILSISYGTTTKKISKHDGFPVFTFGQDTTITMVFKKPVSYYIFKYPNVIAGRTQKMYPVVAQTQSFPGLDGTGMDLYFTAYGQYNVDSSINAAKDVEVNIYYNENGQQLTKNFNGGLDYKTEKPIINNLEIYSSQKVSISKFVITTTQSINPTVADLTCVEISSSIIDMNRAYRLYAHPESSLTIDSITPESLYTLNIDTKESEDMGYTIYYSYSQNDNNPIQIKSKLDLESPNPFSIFLYATSSSSDYPECKKVQLSLEYHADTNNGITYIRQGSLPPVCVPPIATLTIIDNSTIYTSLSLVTKHDSTTSKNKIDRGTTSVFKNKEDVNQTIYIAIEDLCSEVYKTVEVKLREFVTVVINDDFLPKSCIKSDKNTACYGSYDECSEDVEGRVFRGKYNADPGENVNIRFFGDVIFDNSFFRYPHNVTIGPNYNLELKKVKQISGDLDSSFIVDYLSFDPLDTGRINITESQRIKIMPSTGKPFNEINIVFYDDLLIIEGDKDQTDSTKYPKINVYGKGKISLFYYPIDKIVQKYNNPIIEGVYVICNIDNEDIECPLTEYNDYRVIKTLNSIVEELETKTFVYIFLETFSKDINVDITKLNNHTFIFVQNNNQKTLLDENQPRVRFLSTKEATFYSSDIYLGDDKKNYLTLDKDDMGKITVVYENFLTLKVLYATSYNRIPLQIEPIYATSTLFFDKSYAEYDQQIKVDMKNVQSIKVYSGNQYLDLAKVKNIISCGDDRCDENNMDFEVGIPPELIQSPSKSESNNENDDDDGKGKDDKGGLSGGAIAGIVIAVIIVVAAVIVGVIIYMKKKKSNDISSNEANEI